MQYSRFLANVKPSASMTLGLQQMKPGVVNLAIGIPDIPCPGEVKNLLQEAVQNGAFSYVQSRGTKKALNNLNPILFAGEDVDAEKELMLVNGAKFGIYLSLKTCTNAGDAICFMEPYWLSYPDIAYSLGLKIVSWKPVVENGDLNFDFDELRKILKNDPVKVLVINNPNNPAGNIFSREWQEQLNAILIEHGVTLLIDEVYKNLVFDEKEQANFAIKGENILRVGSLSKSLSIPGLRIGYIQASAEFISNADRLNQHISTCINSLSMYLAERITTGTFRGFTALCRQHYKNRFLTVSKILQDSKLPILKSQASFYALIDFAVFFDDGQKACAFLLDQVGILATPGLPYGESFSTYVRICLTRPEEILEEKFKLLLASTYAGI